MLTGSPSLGYLAVAVIARKERRRAYIHLDQDEIYHSHKHGVHDGLHTGEKLFYRCSLGSGIKRASVDDAEEADGK